jgi:DnaJ-class molecular chaperone
VETEKVGHVLTRRACAYCNGTKKFHKYKCNECEGTGVVVASVTFRYPLLLTGS